MDLIELSKRAHIVAMATGVEVPALREDLFPYPMTTDNGVPVFDASRMRPDQVEDVAAVLRGYAPAPVGGPNASKVGMVRAYMQAFGANGVRVQDVVQALQIDKHTALNHLRKMVEEGAVYTKEEQTRGKSASRRIRYFMDAADQRVLPDGSLARSEQYGPARDVGVILHGAPVHALQCPCERCRAALYAWSIGEAETEERKAGRTGLRAGIEAYERARRKAREAAWHAA